LIWIINIIQPAGEDDPQMNPDAMPNILDFTVETTFSASSLTFGGPNLQQINKNRFWTKFI
jgi:hypothetical protein